MGKYNVISNHADKNGVFNPYYMVTRKEDIIPIGAYIRQVSSNGTDEGKIPFTVVCEEDTDPTWATQNANGSATINKDGYYFYDLSFYGIGDEDDYSIALSVQMDRGEYHYNLAENTCGLLSTVSPANVGGLYYLKEGDIVYGNFVSNPGGIHFDSHYLTRLQIVPYQFGEIFWG